jgi:GNAT superfamily N-acetyltransferase
MVPKAQSPRVHQDFKDLHTKWKIIMVREEAGTNEGEGGSVEKAAGMVWVDNKEAEVYLAILQISPEFQGRGLGAGIMRDLVINPSKERKVPAVLHALKVNKVCRKTDRIECIQITIFLESTEVLSNTWIPYCGGRIQQS